MKREAKRQDSRTKEIAELLKKGDLRGLVDLGVPPARIRQLIAAQESGALDQYNPVKAAEQVKEQR